MSEFGIGLADIGIYVPAKHESNHDKRELLQVDDNFIESKVGVHFVSRKADDEETSDMCVQAFHDLARRAHLKPEAVDCLVVVTQNPDGNGLPHTSAIVHGKLGCRDDCAAFDISLGCSGFVYALSIVRSFMMQNNMTCGVLFTSDPYSKILDPADRSTVLLFGDAATATLLTNSPVMYPTAFAFGTRGRDGHVLACVEGVLKMNGRDVFNFSAREVPEQIVRLLQASGLSMEDIDVFVMHQGSRSIVETIQRRLGVSGRFPLKLQEQGNTVSSSIPLILQDILRESSANTVLISGFGVGLSWASAVLKRA
jgi:3-oxoacyl-[acyl-carrier-protein] synthase-3